MNYQRLNNIAGWIIGIIATAVYAMTMERSVSFWDCGEFIPGALKMQVVHPPGAPLFLFVAHFFTLFATSLDKVAIWVNFSSALSTGMAVMFLFWSITALAKKLLRKGQENLDLSDQIAIMMAGAVGALAACFADSIWFSAVEGEVYAMSLFFTSIVFWAILKWENHADEKYADSWLLFIAFLMGLSTGVHLLNLLTIPAIAFVYYFKRYSPTRKGMFITFGISTALLAFVQFGVIQELPHIAALFDRLFVNGFGFAFNTGVYFFLLLVVGAFVYGIYYTHQKNMVLWNTFILSIAFIIIGYMAVLMVPIRSHADPPIDMNNPEDAYSLLSYLNREQYGDRPLLKGPVFTVKREDFEVEDGDTKYIRDEKTGKYEDCGKKTNYIYNDDVQMLFPRMWDHNDGNHVKFYREWLGLNEGEAPTFVDNIKFFIGYQVKYMYMRYFMWNFSGRQNDIQGHGNDKDGNWITGIQAFDKMLVPMDSSKLGGVYENNKGTNKYYMLPLILGLFGMFFHFNKRKYDAFTVLLLFFFTGLGIVLYLNQTPLQPRERDYSYAGSFYAFCIWIGIGMLAIYDYLKNKTSKTAALGIASVVSLFGAPYLMAKDGWNDHDRSTRFCARDFAKNYLNSCPKNAILFTQGDNDTYPLWYAQEVENIRPDIRIINLSLLGVDWYVNQLSHKNNEADAVPLTAKYEQYRGGLRDYLPVYDNKKIKQDSRYPLDQVMAFAFSENSSDKLPLQNGESMNYWPVKKLMIKVDKANCLAQGILPLNDSTSFPEYIPFEISGSNVLKNDLFTLDIINANNWKRPVCFAISVSPDAFVGLNKYMHIEGMIVRLTPFENKQTTSYMFNGDVDTKIMYPNVVKFEFGGLQNNNVYLDETGMRMAQSLQSCFGRLAEQLAAEGQNEKALEILDKCVANMSAQQVPYSLFMMHFIDTYYKCGKPEKARAIITEMKRNANAELDAYFATNEIGNYDRDIQENLYVYQNMVKYSQQSNDTTFAKNINTQFQKYIGKYNQLRGGAPMN
jgi:hypothetical protein